MVLSTYVFIFSISATVESVSLELWDTSNAGGDDISVEIVQDNTSCNVTEVARINRNEIKTWSTESDLGTCFGTSFDIDASGIPFRLKTTHVGPIFGIWKNDFKPKTVTIIIGKTTFKSEVMNDWVDANKGFMLRNANKGCGNGFSGEKCTGNLLTIYYFK